MDDLRGVLAPGVLPGVLRDIADLHRSGFLSIASGAERARIEVIEGALGQVDSTVPGTRLGDLLVQIGYLGPRERDLSLELSALSKERFGQTLLRHGLIDPSHLEQGLALQLREVLSRALTWEEGVYSFEGGAPASPRSAPRVDARAILMDAVWSLMGQAALGAILGDTTRRLRAPREEWLTRLAPLAARLSPQDAYLLSRVDGALTGDELLQLSPQPLEEARAGLAALLATGAIQFVEAAAPRTHTAEVVRAEWARLEKQTMASDPFAVLGLPKEADRAEVRAAYLRILRSCAPATASAARQREILNDISERAGRAFREIEGRRAVRTIPPHAPPPSAPSAKAGSAPSASPGPAGPGVVRTPHPPVAPTNPIEAADHSLEQGRLHEALGILHEALPRLAGAALRAARSRRARILLSAGSERLAEEELREALREDAGHVEARFLLASLLKDRGAAALASAEYRRVLALDPRHAEAREALRQIESAGVIEPGPSEPSVLQRIFRRPPS